MLCFVNNCIMFAIRVYFEFIFYENGLFCYFVLTTLLDLYYIYRYICVCVFVRACMPIPVTARSKA
jgi:hypothetical protein